MPDVRADRERHCFRCADGGKVRERQGHWPEGRTALHTPSRDLVFLHGAGALSALDAQSGDLAWQIPARGHVYISLVRDRLYVGEAGDLSAVDWTTGRVNRRYQLENSISFFGSDGATVAVGQWVISRGFAVRFLLGLDAATGRELWRFPEGYEGYFEPVAFIGSTIYVEGRQGWAKWLLALDARTGRERWCIPCGWINRKDPVNPVCPWSDGTILVCDPENADAWAKVVDPGSGEMLWRPAPGWSQPGVTPVEIGAASELALVAAITKDGEAIGFTTDRPDPVWRFSPDRHPDAGELEFVEVKNIGNDARSDDGYCFNWFRSGYTRSDSSGALLLMDEHNLYLLDGRTGRQTWRSPLALSGLNPESVRAYRYGDRLFVTDGHVLAAFRRE